MTKHTMRTTIGAALVALGSVLVACVPQTPTGPGPCVDGWQQMFEAPVTDAVPSLVPEYGSGLASAALSEDGRYLALGATPATPAITVRDLVTGATEAAPGSTYLDSAPLISADGSIVAFRRYTLPTNSFHPPMITVVWNRTRGAITTVPDTLDESRPVDMTPDGATVLVQTNVRGELRLSRTIVYDTPSAAGTSLDLSAILANGTTQAAAMSDDAVHIALTVTSDSGQITGIYHRDTRALTPVAPGYRIQALDGDGRLVALSDLSNSGSLWHEPTNTLIPLGADIPLAINRAGTTAIVTRYTPAGPGWAISSLDLATRQHHLISSTSPRLVVSGDAGLDRVVEIETSPDRAVVKQRC